MQKVVWSDVDLMAKKNLANLVFQSEENFAAQVQVVADDVFNKHYVRIIMIAGPSSSGKTTFSKILNEKLQAKGVKVHNIEMDNFFIDRDKVPFLESGLRDYDSPQTLDLPLLHEAIDGVLNCDTVEIPEYDFISGTRKDEKIVIKPQGEDIVIIEGIHALNPAVVGCDSSQIVKVSIKPRKTYIMPSGKTLLPDELRLLRRTIRDYYTRGHSFEATAIQWKEVCNAEKKYIDPFTDNADYFIDSAFDYELFVYKQCLGGALDGCDLAEFANIKNALEEIGDVPEIQIPTTSLLNEFAIAKHSLAAD